MFQSADKFFDNKRVVLRKCPISVGREYPVACNCIGRCQPIFVSKDDTRTDQEIIEAYER